MAEKEKPKETVKIGPATVTKPTLTVKEK